MRIWMIPGLHEEGDRTTGISQVVHKYVEYLQKDHGVEFVHDNTADLIVGHAGVTRDTCDVAIIHGLYWTGDYKASKGEFAANANIVKSVIAAKEITVPSDWVQKVFQRDMRISPTVIHHGIEAHEWEHNFRHEHYVLWNKNRPGDVCSPLAVTKLAKMVPSVNFVSTFVADGAPNNIKVIGKQSFDDMKHIVQRSGVYLSLVKETFGIGTLEAMASGVPILGWNYGGNTVLVKHGVNGYLAEPDNYDDLEAGLKYCIANAKILGDNGIELARNFKWVDSVNKLYSVFERALENKRSGVSVIIPVYNYADKVSRAIESVCKQTVKPEEIIVVDDGSSDNPEPVIENIANKNPSIKIKYIRQENAGVAEARNTGFLNSSGKYICCLDADDAVEPEFLHACTDYLDKNPSVYTAYTKLRYIKPNGETGISNWPDTYKYDNFLRKQNQVPTCNVSRREVWERLGGQRSRYAPVGAGSEDAEMWLRAGAHGMGGALATSAPLFVYSWMSGMVSGNKDYKEVDWIKMHPWTRDNMHPFPSLATPANDISHPVYQYDIPIISIIIPVAKGHEKLLINALDSIEAQGFRKWEVVVVYDCDDKLPDFTTNAYPYVKFLNTTNERRGAGAARNIGVENSSAKLLFFLDADDELAIDALENMLDAYNQTGDIIYSDYVGVVPFEDEKISHEQYRDRFIEYNKRKKVAHVKFKALDFDCEKAQKQPDEKDLYEWSLVSVLVPKSFHNDIGGFDESLRVIEDVDYHWRMAKSGKCYTHINKMCLYIDFKSGTNKSEKKDFSKTIKIIKEKYRSIKNMGCSGCGSKKSISKPTKRTVDVNNLALSDAVLKSAKNISDAKDDDFVRVLYKSKNVGNHQVVGQITKINYGYKRGGQIMLLHKKDYEVMKNLFEQIHVEKKNQTTPEPPPAPLPLPEPIKIEEHKDQKEPVVYVGTKDADLISTLMVGLSVSTYEELAKKSDEDILSVSGIGKAKLKRAREILAKA